ncbi:TonB-dependent receptor [Edaphobacter bradus]|uniref:TonB-dependent receptor n=1 Tax=Edaphobacter bradus TaxID=2259016 RepID=UPI0021E06F17|nr:TonB-dependent receptor [Edaphobacter bradus]
MKHSIHHPVKSATYYVARFVAMRKSILLLLALVCLFLLPVALLAQYENGSIVGTVHDATGAVVPGATVKVTNSATGIVSTRTTNDSGDYEVPELRVGQYNVDVSKYGFASSRATDITVSVATRQRIDLTLKVGETSTTVEVTGVSLQVETDTSQREQIVTQYQSAALPLVSRNYSDLLGLVTGARQAPTAATTSSISSLVRAGAYNVNGQRSMFNNYLLDGMDNNAYGESNQGFDNQIIAVPPDSVAQFAIVTNNESAEYGRSSGATINVASASGTNRFHGAVYEFIRNTDLNAAGFFKPNIVSNTGSVVPFKKSTFNRNQFGMNVGGPIVHDKLFFFLDYEGFRQTLKPLSVLTLPTQNELNGILVVPVKNPTTGTVYAAGTPIPAAAINPLSRQIVSYFKQIPGLPVSGLASTGLASNDYAVQAPFTDNADKGDLRLDYQQNPSSSWFLRISDRKENAVNNPTIPLPLDGQTNGKIRILDQQVALGYTHLIGADKIIDARLGLSRTKAGKYTLSIGNNAFTIPGLPSNPVVAGGLPSIGITGFTGFGRQSTNPQWQNPALIDPKVNFTWARGKHSLKFGYEYEHIWMAVNDNNPLYGSYTYGGGYSASGSTVSDTYWADFLFGTTSAYSLANYFVAHLRQTMQSVYAQDDWKVTPKLTLNLGLRWEYGSPYSEQHNYISNFDPISQTVLTLSPGATAGNGITPYHGGGVYGSTLVNPDLNDFGPRVGFAYAPQANTSIRGGFGMNFVHYTRAGSGDILAINAPQALFVSVPQTGSLAPNPANKCPNGAPATNCYVTADQGYPSTLVTTFNPATDNITWVPKDTRDSYVESYFLSVQRELSKNILLDVAYVGNHGLKLQGFLNANQKNPSLGFTRPYANWPSDITAAVNEFYSNYNALQVRYEQRMVGGLTLLNSFSWEHSLDNASASLEGNTPSPQDANNIRADYSQSDYNLPIANVTSLVYELPFGRGRKYLSGANGLIDSVLGGWQISAINTAQAGTPFNLVYSPNSATAASPQIGATYRGANEYRPNRVQGQKVTQGRSSRSAGTGYVNYINYNAFVLPATKSASGALLSPFGNASRNPGRTPAFYQTDLAANKKFSTPIESLKVEFRTEFYNIFNHTNLYLPSSGLGGTLQSFSSNGSVANSGTPTSGGQITSTFEPRIIQFGLKVMF